MYGYGWEIWLQLYQTTLLWIGKTTKTQVLLTDSSAWAHTALVAKWEQIPELNSMQLIKQCLSLNDLYCRQNVSPAEKRACPILAFPHSFCHLCIYRFQMSLRQLQIHIVSLYSSPATSTTSQPTHAPISNKYKSSKTMQTWPKIIPSQCCQCICWRKYTHYMSCSQSCPFLLYFWFLSVNLRLMLYILTPYTCSRMP